MGYRFKTEPCYYFFLFLKRTKDQTNQSPANTTTVVIIIHHRLAAHHPEREVCGVPLIVIPANRVKWLTLADTSPV